MSWRGCWDYRRKDGRFENSGLCGKIMAKLVEITGKAMSGEWGFDDETGNGIPVLRTTNFTNEGVVDYKNVVTRTIIKKNIDEKYLRPGDVIIEKSGGSDKQPVGRVVYFNGPEKTYLFNNFTGLLRVKDQTLWFPKYIFYSLYGNYRRGGTRAFENKTTGLHNLKVDDYVSRYEITELDHKKQIEVCEYLDKIYKVIKLREEELQKLDDLIKARFVELFGDPIKNPKGWDVVKLSECLERIDNGKSFTCDSNAREGAFPAILKLSAATYGDYRPYENKALLDEKQFVESVEVHRGDLLFTRKNTPDLVGMAAYVFETPEKLMMPDLIFRLVTNERMTPIFLWQLINNREFRPVIQGISGGSAKSMSNISKERLKNIEIICPTISEQKKLEGVLDQVNKSKVKVQKALDETQKLFDSLMQQYFG